MIYFERTNLYVNLLSNLPLLDFVTNV
jgi:hypothetical protein